MYKTLLIMHVISASVALPAGLVPIMSKKGGKTHRRWGLLYYYAMYGVSCSALLMTLIKWNPFLMCLGVFSLYLTYTGRKALWYMREKEPYKPRLKDRLPVLIALATGIVMLGYPAWQYFASGRLPLSVLQVFGMIQLAFALADLRTLRNPVHFQPGNQSWLRQHIARMGGAYIATTTAFLVVNVNFSPGWVVWLAPTAVGTMLISASIRKLQKGSSRA